MRQTAEASEIVILITFESDFHVLYGTPEKIYITLKTKGGTNSINLNKIVIPEIVSYSVVAE